MRGDLEYFRTAQGRSREPPDRQISRARNARPANRVGTRLWGFRARRPRRSARCRAAGGVSGGGQNLVSPADARKHSLDRIPVKSAEEPMPHERQCPCGALLRSARLDPPQEPGAVYVSGHRRRLPRPRVSRTTAAERHSHHRTTGSRCRAELRIARASIWIGTTDGSRPDRTWRSINRLLPPAGD